MSSAGKTSEASRFWTSGAHLPAQLVAPRSGFGWTKARAPARMQARGARRVEERSADNAYSRSARHKATSHIRLLVQPGAHRLRVRAWCSAIDVKQRLRDACGVPVGFIRLFHGPRELPNLARMIDLLPSSSRNSSSSSSSRSRVAEDAEMPVPLTKLLSKCQQGLAMGFAPQLAWDGTGGTYVLRDASRAPLAAFKPRDEEAFAPNNPRGLPGKLGQPGIHGSIASGEAHVREVLAHRLDHGHFASVPLTLQAEAVHPAFYVHSHVALSRYGAKVGSLQLWVPHDDVAANRGAATFPTREVHKIALLDMRLLNTDRNDSNILVRDMLVRECELVPIDHGGCLPSSAAISWFDWCWLSWPQMSVPPDAETRAYAKLLAEYGVPPAAIRASCCATLLVQATVAAGLSLLDAALLLCRPDDDAPSELERLIAQAERLTAHALSKPRLPEERRARHASYEQAYALSNPRLRSHADGATYSPDLKQPKQRQAVGFGARPDRSLSAEDLSSLDARGSAPASPRGGALPAASLPTLLHRVSSERAIGSATASSPSASCGATGGTGPAAAGACGGASSLLDGHIAFDGSAAEETFYDENNLARLVPRSSRSSIKEDEEDSS
ncbi:hypothetical protein EMIHUDRAFT_450250 [Emiliania huxleyi CCMP1516]|uniref:PI3K/PI4K catalytic domain-containing protein n=2 Tax=Emiliania huxleyi TaxID=2903 RepID=A0A0D3JS76_EMIH1|nr:hypothetical protein EMIHUDRAFT_450250 [Emiliania huxleyi CCMP1516]EOD26361.1 hypothetical protein EMIHUDRAFT_450250 [Emiliania huxleyi CCMP1516]|eukprot:XP_005778790.1 hypothetical protein EMIHUDRAFT_450250 [Emiliania huxleyi CCMP1516]